MPQSGILLMVAGKAFHQEKALFLGFPLGGEREAFFPSFAVQSENLCRRGKLLSRSASATEAVAERD